MTAAGDDKLTNCVPGRVWDDYRDTAAMKQDGSNRLSDEEVEESERISTGAAERRDLRRLDNVPVRAAI